MVYIGWRYYYEIHGLLIPIHDFVGDKEHPELIIHENGEQEEVSAGRIRKKAYVKGR